MPTFDASFKDFEKLVGTKLPKDEEKLWKKLLLVKSEVEELDIKKDYIKFEPSDSNRPDMWNVEGLARALKGALSIETGIPKYKVVNSNKKIIVEKNIKKIRPFIACAIVKGLKFDDSLIKQLIQLQLKIDGSFGRKRRKSSTGIYNYDLIDFPITYKAVKKDEVKFIPLGFDKLMTPTQILKTHPKGLEYGKILENDKEVPILIDSKGKILSMPPIINSNEVGKITKKSKNVLIEVTGLNKETVNGSLNVIISALADRGGKIESVMINYPSDEKVSSPNMINKEFSFDRLSIKKRLGISFSDNELKELLLRARFDVKKITKEQVIIKIPFYRLDIMHKYDIIEDIAVMKGFENIESEEISFSSTGKLNQETIYNDRLRELIIGLSYQEVLNYYRCDKSILFNKECIEISNPIGSTMNVLRNELAPVLINWLSKNTHNVYPQNIFEIGKVFIKKKGKIQEINNICIMSANANASFTEIRQILDWILSSLGIKDYEIKEKDYEILIPGRSAQILIKGKLAGYFGEVHPKTINEYGIEVPIMFLEMNIEKIKK